MLLVVVTGFGHHFQAINVQTEPLTTDPLTMPGNGAESNRAMSREETKPKLKPLLLAFALATVLTWYLIYPIPGPIPGPIPRLQKEDDAREGERRQSHTSGRSLLFGRRPTIRPAIAPVLPATDEDLPDWPEFIELD